MHEKKTRKSCRNTPLQLMFPQNVLFFKLLPIIESTTWLKMEFFLCIFAGDKKISRAVTAKSDQCFISHYNPTNSM